MPGRLTRRIAATLSAAVQARGLTQQEVADIIGQSQKQVSRYLRGEVVLDVEELSVICQFLDLDMSELIRESQAGDDRP